jgi:glucose/arabinose dehydrogenase
MKTKVIPAFSNGNFILKVIFALAIFCYYTPVFSQPVLTFTPYVRGLTVPVEVRNAGDGSGRIFVTEQGGKIKIIKNGMVQPRPFLDISNITGYATFWGLWSIAFTPDYSSSGFFFVLYSAKGGNTELVRYQVSNQNADIADTSTRTVLFSLKGSGTGGPHFGQLHFGKDGYLYLTISDGSNPYNTTPFAQMGSNLFGKMLRIDVKVTNAPYYRIPPDNPFLNDPRVRDEIWALGFRNAWRWSFDMPTGNLWLPDVQGEQAEELNVLSPASAGAGLNFGWPCYEAKLPYLNENCRPPSKYRFPDFSYLHDVPEGGETIIGGYVYRGAAYPALQNNYVCSDYTSNNAWVIWRTARGRLVNNLQTNIPPLIQSYGLDEAGEMYAVAGNGIIYRVGAVNANVTVSAAQGSNAYAATMNKIYPTIAGSYIILQMKDTFRELRITDMNGKEIMHRTINSNGIMQIALPRLSAGMYFVNLDGKTNLKQKIYVSQ